MKTQVYSEIGQLKKVMVHAPGREIEVIVPEGANDLLFEDILFAERAREEHELLCKVFEKYGVETFDIKTILFQSLEKANRDTVIKLLNDLKMLEHLTNFVITKLKELSAAELSSALIEGILLDPENMDDENLYLLSPIPNLLFARDPVIIAFDKIFASSMAEPVRRRESQLLKFIFTNHPELTTDNDIIDLHELSTEGTKLTLEGGDFLVLDEDTVAIAWSKRTTLKSIKLIANELKKVGVKHLIVAKLPHQTSFIHLDTVFTRISEDECLIYPPLFTSESQARADILYFDLEAPVLKEKRYDLIFDILDEIGINLKPIYCGGKDNLINQKREQWTQGANSFCIAPGIILTYSRNRFTIKELAAAGYMCINAKEVISSTFSVNFSQKTAILLDGEELCRARGGPRCLTHPLVRDRRNPAKIVQRNQ